MNRERVRLKGPDDVLLLALIDLHTLDFPICFGKRSAVLLHELIARWDTRYLRAALVLAWNTSIGPHSASPITAKGSVEDSTVVLEELERIAVGSRPECAGRAPITRNGSLSGDVGWDVLPIKEINGDTRVVPKHRVDTTTVLIERLAKRIGLSRPDTASLVVGLQRGTVRATDKGS